MLSYCTYTVEGSYVRPWLSPFRLHLRCRSGCYPFILLLGEFLVNFFSNFNLDWIRLELDLKVIVIRLISVTNDARFEYRNNNS